MNFGLKFKDFKLFFFPSMAVCFCIDQFQYVYKIDINYDL